MALLLENGAVVTDPWTVLDDAAGSDGIPEGPVIVSLERWQRDRAVLELRNAPLGIRLKSHQLAGEIAADLDRFGLVVLELPKFRDGRAFSTARLLRERYGFTGEIRATGAMIPDQFLFLVRCGVSSVEVPDNADLAVWRHALTEITIAYQAAATADEPLSLLRRRLSP
ncbi:MAG: DUF934 domain-containing protein [Azospirillaceae bacterium]|nr:DUF934 domain-containing protein [Azospirillaceae bacterium]